MKGKKNMNAKRIEPKSSQDTTPPPPFQATPQKSASFAVPNLEKKIKKLAESGSKTTAPCGKNKSAEGGSKNLAEGGANTPGKNQKNVSTSLTNELDKLKVKSNVGKPKIEDEQQRNLRVGIGNNEMKSVGKWKANYTVFENKEELIKELFKAFKPNTSCNLKLKDFNYVGHDKGTVKMRVTCKADKQKKVKSCGNKFTFVVLREGLNEQQVIVYASEENIKKVHEPISGVVHTKKEFATVKTKKKNNEKKQPIAVEETLAQPKKVPKDIPSTNEKEIKKPNTYLVKTLSATPDYDRGDINLKIARQRCLIPPRYPFDEVFYGVSSLIERLNFRAKVSFKDLPNRFDYIFKKLGINCNFQILNYVTRPDNDYITITYFCSHDSKLGIIGCGIKAILIVDYEDKDSVDDKVHIFATSLTFCPTNLKNLIPPKVNKNERSMKNVEKPQETKEKTNQPVKVQTKIEKKNDKKMDHNLNAEKQIVKKPKFSSLSNDNDCLDLKTAKTLYKIPPNNKCSDFFHSIGYTENCLGKETSNYIRLEKGINPILRNFGVNCQLKIHQARKTASNDSVRVNGFCREVSCANKIIVILTTELTVEEANERLYLFATSKTHLGQECTTDDKEEGKINHENLMETNEKNHLKEALKPCRDVQENVVDEMEPPLKKFKKDENPTPQKKESPVDVPRDLDSSKESPIQAVSIVNHVELEAPIFENSEEKQNISLPSCIDLSGSLSMNEVSGESTSENVTKIDPNSITKLEVFESGILKNRSQWESYYGNGGKIAFLVEVAGVSMKSIDCGDFLSLVRTEEQLTSDMVEFLIKVICKNKRDSVYVLPLKKVDSFLKVNDDEMDWFKENVQDDELQEIFTKNTVIMPIFFLNVNPYDQRNVTEVKSANHYALLIICNDRKNVWYMDSMLPVSIRKRNNTTAKKFFTTYLDKRKLFREKQGLQQEKDGIWNLLLPHDYKIQKDDSACGVLVGEFLTLFFENQLHLKKQEKNQPEAYQPEEIINLRKKFTDLVLTLADRPLGYCSSCNEYIHVFTETIICRMCERSFHRIHDDAKPLRETLGIETFICRLCCHYLKNINNID